MFQGIRQTSREKEEKQVGKKEKKGDGKSWNWTRGVKRAERKSRSKENNVGDYREIEKDGKTKKRLEKTKKFKFTTIDT